MMSTRRTFRAAACLGLSAAAFGAVPALAEDAPKETVTEELIRLLAEHNALSKDDASKLIKRLQDEQAAAQPAAPPTAATTPNAAAPAAGVSAGAAPGGAADKGRVRVIYVPESEKAKIREEVKQEVIAQAKAENWAQPYALPGWVKRFRFDGDFRYRQEFDLYDSGNDVNFINFQAINSGAPVNVNPAANGGILVVPFLDTTEDRELPRVRLRLNATTSVADDLDVGMRVTTGNNTNPVSSNQTLGTDFNKMTLVVDRAYFDYRPTRGMDVWAGRMPSPWQSTSMIWYEDLNFDGIAGRYRYVLSDRFAPRLTVGAFSVENTALDFPSTSSGKVASRDKWLFATQLGADWMMNPGTSLAASAAYYYFYHLEGKLSDCVPNPLSASVGCPSDESRPGFIQKGNTLFALRNEAPLQPTDPTFEYFGLASRFHVFDAVLSADQVLRGPVHLGFDADYAYNLGYNRRRVNALVPVNNYPDCPQNQTCTTPETGNVAFLFQLRTGYPVVRERWQWNVYGGYRRIESDAVVDAFNDPDFAIGGTNTKGFHLGSNIGLAHNAWLNARWFSSTEVSGPKLAIDVLQIDMNARF